MKKVLLAGYYGHDNLGDEAIAEALTKVSTKITQNGELIEVPESMSEDDLEDEFEDIDKSIDLINKISNISEVEPMTHTLDDFVYELRDDEATESVPIEDLLANSDDTEDREIVVPKVVG